MNHLINFFHKYKLPFIGLIIVLLFIWLRFIRQRFSKDIPFLYLSPWGFFILTFICCVYILIIKSLVKPVQKSNVISEYIIPLLYAPLEAFDALFKKTLKINVESLVLKYQMFLEYILSKTYIYYFVLGIFPRIVLVSVLFFDTLYFHRLHYIYYFVFLTILLFLNKYIIYSLKVVKKDSIKFLTLYLSHITCDFCESAFTEEERVDPEFHDTGTMCLPVERFFDYMTNKIVYNGYSMEYNSYLSTGYTDEYYNEFRIKHALKLNNEIPKNFWAIILQEEKELYLPKVKNTVKISCLIEEFSYAHNSNKKFKYIKALIFSTYFLCWFYILIKSLPNLNLIDLIEYLNFICRLLENPFSGNILGLLEINKITLKYDFMTIFDVYYDESD